MKLTIEQAERALEIGIKAKAPNGNFWQAKRNGQTQRWKTRPNEYRIPIRLGFKGNTYATHQSEWNFYGEGPNADFQIQTVAGRHEILGTEPSCPDCGSTDETTNEDGTAFCAGCGRKLFAVEQI